MNRWCQDTTNIGDHLNSSLPSPLAGEGPGMGGMSVSGPCLQNPSERNLCLRNATSHESLMASSRESGMPCDRKFRRWPKTESRDQVGLVAEMGVIVNECVETFAPPTPTLPPQGGEGENALSQKFGNE
jgi:hypothetical protein